MIREEQLKILKFWRDVEVFNIPPVPKKEKKLTAKGKKLTLKVAKYWHDDALPWQSGHADALVATAQEDWIHAVFVGVAACRDWAQVVLGAACREQQLSVSDLQQLGGEGWLAAFVVNSAGQMVGDSYVPASFSLGVQRLLSEKTLDGLNSDIQEQAQAFKERHPGISSFSDDAEQAKSQSTIVQPQMPSEKPLPTPIGWTELNAELRTH